LLYDGRIEEIDRKNTHKGDIIDYDGKSAVVITRGSKQTANVSKLNSLPDDAARVDVYDNAIANNGKIDIKSSAGKPQQLHHYLSNKNSKRSEQFTEKFKKITEKFKKITDKYGLDLDDKWNKDYLPHQGSHAKECHQYIYEQIQNIDDFAKGDKEVFKDLFEQTKQIVKDKPEMMYKNYWEIK